MFGKTRSNPKTGARIEGSRQIWAIGDVHGCSDLLARLITYLKAAPREEPRLTLVFLGDYVDRGPDSRGVVDQLLALRAEPQILPVCLLGNHDQVLLDFLVDARVGPGWHRFGAGTTLRSYGVAEPVRLTDIDEWAETRASFAEALPAEHLAFFRGLLESVTFGDYFLCHAGARPGRALSKQTAEDLLWIREPFLSHSKPFEKMIVHGHTPAEGPYADDRRIGVDTGAYATGVLTAVRLDGHEPLFVQARRDAADPSQIGILVSASEPGRQAG